MFRLKKLDIHGFKSFVDKVTVTLPSRITAIVGPNGSGKSNICDAVQWVLGEQRASVLRGTTMDDVIFNGSARRRPMGLAEVTLTLEARGDHWKETGGEVVITRRVHRDGESDYLLNGKRSRLKDIQEILMGTGLGVRAYSIIEQQKIDLILSTKPQDRRRLIEEASGISKYKMRKRQAELKLEETRSNLLRLSDIVSEIERTCTSLKRQAGRAARWKEQADVLAALKKKLSRLRADRLTDALVAAEATLLAANEREAAAMADLVARDAEATDDRRRADEDERQGRALSETLAKAREALLAAEAAVATAEKDVDEGRARQQLLLAQQREAEADHVRSAEESARGQELLEEVDRSLGTAEEKAREAAQALAEAVRQEADSNARREAARRELLQAAGRAADATNREREAALLADRLSFALAKLEERKLKADEVVAERQRVLSELETRESETALALEVARQRLEETGLSRKAAEEKLASLKSEREAKQARRHQVEVRIAALETTLKARESGGEAARKALASIGLSEFTVLADHFDAQEGFETALDAALGSALEAPVVRDRASVDGVVAAVRAAKLGTARFIHPISGSPAEPEAMPSDARVQGFSHDLLTPKPGDEALLRALPDAVVVDTMDDALAMASLFPDRTLVTKDGIVVRGSVVEAAGTEVPGEGLFTVRRDLKALAHERDELVARIEGLSLDVTGTTSEASQLAQAVDREIAASRRADREHSEASARVKGAREEHRRAERERLVLGEEEKGLRSDLTRAGENRSEAATLVAQRNAESAIVERTIGELEAAVDTLRGTRLSFAEAEALARGARDVLRERRRAAKETFETHRSRAEGQARRLLDIARQLEELKGREENGLVSGEEARERSARAKEAAALAESARTAFDAEAQERRTSREANDRAAHAARELVDQTRKLRFEAELSVERKKADWDYLIETCRNEFGCAPLELPAVELAEGEALPDEAALAEDVTQKTLALEKLGPVNHAALEEFDTESKRHQELSTQKLDLERSLEQILETIGTINETSSERFREAFMAINANFSQVFQRLFRGGQASMHLLDETDMLESGLEIMAQPPGKRNQTIGLLSGGEKALTAVALLVAIFKFKPSPFCIMDEVDAPLDEANIDRFTGLLQELSEETQFVLITHSKRTMETAQALYGVTQEEPGVSKLVSVRFD